MHVAHLCQGWTTDWSSNYWLPDYGISDGYSTLCLYRSFLFLKFKFEQLVIKAYPQRIKVQAFNKNTDFRHFPYILQEKSKATVFSTHVDWLTQNHHWFPRRASKDQQIQKHIPVQQVWVIPMVMNINAETAHVKNQLKLNILVRYIKKQVLCW